MIRAINTPAGGVPSGALALADSLSSSTTERGHKDLMKVIFSDLDGALLNAATYDCDAAEPALNLLRAEAVPLVFCTSKTRAEVEYWRRKLDIRDPFIVENGAAIFIPQGCFPIPIPSAVSRCGYQVVEFGKPRRLLVDSLAQACRESGRRVRAFNQLSIREIAAVTGLPLNQARLAARREYDEPFEILGSDHRPLLRAIERRGLRWTVGGRYYHITGGHDKAVAVRWLTELYRRAFGTVKTAGLGDAPNDIEFLKAVDDAIVVRSAFATVMQAAAPGSRITAVSGAAGWNQAVLQLLAA